MGARPKMETAPRLHVDFAVTRLKIVHISAHDEHIIMSNISMLNR